MLVLQITQPTFLKLKPMQSRDLSPIDMILKSPCRIYLEDWEEIGDHVKVTFRGDYEGYRSWYIWEGHCKVWDDQTQIFPGAKNAELLLRVPYFSQRDNLEGWWRTCNSSCCAMCLEYFKPEAIVSDDQYYQRVKHFGDTTDHRAQTLALESYGLKSSFHYNLGYAEVLKSLDQKKPVVLGILHKGNISAPEGGHMIVAIGRWERGLICHDPWGSLNSGYVNQNGRQVYYSYKSLNARWLNQRGISETPSLSKTGWGRLFA